jgi:hypothetical protein
VRYDWLSESRIKIGNCSGAAATPTMVGRIAGLAHRFPSGAGHADIIKDGRIHGKVRARFVRRLMSAAVVC